MKTLKLIFLGIVLFFASTLQAQVSVNVNIGSPPMWGPVGYSDVHYYYLPDVEAYYDVNASMFIYFEGGNWIHRSNLPGRYRNYDLYGGYKVVMNDYHGNRPYDNFREHKGKYRKGYRGPSQRSIGQRPGRGNGGGKMHNEGRSYKGGNQDHGRNVGQGRVQGGNKGRVQGGNKGRGQDGGKGRGEGGGKGKH